MTPGTKIAGVNGRLYPQEALADAISNSKDETKGIELLVIDTDYYKTCNVDYH